MLSKNFLIWLISTISFKLNVGYIQSNFGSSIQFSCPIKYASDKWKVQWACQDSIFSRISNYVHLLGCICYRFTWLHRDIFTQWYIVFLIIFNYFTTFSSTLTIMYLVILLGLKIRVYASIGKSNKGKFALDLAVKTLDLYKRYSLITWFLSHSCFLHSPN